MKQIFLGSLLIVFLFPTVETQAELGLTAYRDLSGELTSQSKKNASAMTRLAAKNGHITILLMLNYPFNIYLDQMTESELKAQEEGVRNGFAEVLDALVANKKVWYPESGPYISGPSCTVRATVAGLQQLVHDERILQIVAFDE